MSKKSQSKNSPNIEEIIQISSCPHCSSTAIVRNGHKNNKQQYKCKKCKKNFLATTGTPTHWIHLKSKIAKYSEALKLGMTIREAAKFVEISKNTSFNWRHKLLSSIKSDQILKENKKASAVIIFKTPYNDKGRRKSPEKIRKDSKTIMLTQGKQITIQKLDFKNQTKQITNILIKREIINPIKSRELTIVSQKISKNQKLRRKNLKTKLTKDIKIQVQLLNQWMSRFRGVASKYLQQYWNWFCGLQNIKVLKEEYSAFFQLCIENKTLNEYRKMRMI